MSLIDEIFASPEAKELMENWDRSELSSVENSIIDCLTKQPNVKRISIPEVEEYKFTICGAPTVLDFYIRLDSFKRNTPLDAKLASLSRDDETGCLTFTFQRFKPE